MKSITGVVLLVTLLVCPSFNTAVAEDGSQSKAGSLELTVAESTEEEQPLTTVAAKRPAKVVATLFSSDVCGEFPAGATLTSRLMISGISDPVEKTVTIGKNFVLKGTSSIDIELPVTLPKSGLYKGTITVKGTNSEGIVCTGSIDLHIAAIDSKSMKLQAVGSLLYPEGMVLVVKTKIKGFKQIRKELRSKGLENTVLEELFSEYGIYKALKKSMSVRVRGKKLELGAEPDVGDSAGTVCIKFSLPKGNKLLPSTLRYSFRLMLEDKGFKTPVTEGKTSFYVKAKTKALKQCNQIEKHTSYDQILGAGWKRVPGKGWRQV